MSNRGYSLIELMVATVVALLVMGVTIGVFLTQQRSFASLDLTRVSQDASRNALMNMEPALRRVGFGIDPRYAIDMQTYQCTTAPCRDKIDGPDELVFVARSPYYRWSDVGENGCTTTGGCFLGNAWPISATTATTVTITATAGDSFVKGQVIQGVCSSGSLATMGTISATTTATADGTLSLPLATAVAGNAYKENNFTASCFSTAGAAVFLVDRFRFAVVTFSNTPWLVLDNGLDVNGNGTTPDAGDLDDLIPLAKGVEDMQIAYLYNSNGGTGPDADQNWIVGDKSGTQEEPNPAATAPLYATGSNDASRFNLHPANVRGIRVSISVESLHPDRSQPATWTGDLLTLRENRNTQPTSLGNRRRFASSTSVILRNMDARSLAIF